MDCKAKGSSLRKKVPPYYTLQSQWKGCRLIILYSLSENYSTGSGEAQEQKQEAKGKNGWWRLTRRGPQHSIAHLLGCHSVYHVHHVPDDVLQGQIRQLFGAVLEGSHRDAHRRGHLISHEGRRHLTHEVNDALSAGGVDVNRCGQINYGGVLAGIDGILQAVLKVRDCEGSL